MKHVEFRNFNKYADGNGELSEDVEGIAGLHWLVVDYHGWGGMLKEWRKHSTAWMEKVSNFGTVVSAGGNCGMYPRFYGEYFNTVYSFEPDPACFDCLQLNCDGDKYILDQSALSNTASTDNYSLERVQNDNRGSIRLIKDSNGNVETVRLDDLNLTELDLLHLDLEGHEPEALEGALDAIREFTPVIIVERSIYPKSYLKATKILRDCGYKPFRSIDEYPAKSEHKNTDRINMDAIWIP